MTRYNIYAEGDEHECELKIDEEEWGEWVKWEDVLLMISYLKREIDEIANDVTAVEP